MSSTHSGPIHPDAAEASFNLPMLLRDLRRNRLLLACCILFGLGLGLFAALLPRHYTAISKIQVRPGSSSQYRVDKTDLLNIGDDSTKLETETQILESDTLLLNIAQKLHLDTNPDFMGPIIPGEDRSDPKFQEKLLLRLHQNIHTVLVPRTEIIQVACNTKSGVLSAQVANTLVAEYIQRLFESRFSSTQRVAKWLSGQLGDLKDQVESDEEKLIQLQNRLGIVGLDQTHDIVVTELEDLTKAADESRAQRIIAEARYRILNEGDLSLLEGGQDIPGRNATNSAQVSLLANLRNQKAQIEARYAGLNAQFGPKYIEVQQAAAELATLNREIDKEQSRVLNQARQAFSAATSDEQKSFATLNGKKHEAFQKHNDMVQYQILLHDYESNRSLYEGLVQRLRQAGIVAGLESSEVDIIDLARIPGRPSELGRTITVLLGLLFGLALGLAAAFAVSHFDQRPQDLSAIESEMGLPLLSITTRTDKAEGSDSTSPRAGLLHNIPDAFIKQPGSAFVESMWSLRASLLLSNPKHSPRVIMFTSCNPAEGKTTIACGQACALALREARVLLIDADMRRPSVMRRLGLKNTVGLSSLLTGRTTVEGAIQHVPAVPNLSVITSGPIPPSASLLLSSDHMAELVESLKSLYDFIIIDSPPLLGLVDSSSLAAFAEAVVLVLSYRSLNKAQVLRARRNLHRVDRAVTGIALNFADADQLSDYGYGYGYGAYKYTASEQKGGAS